MLLKRCFGVLVYYRTPSQKLKQDKFRLNIIVIHKCSIICPADYWNNLTLAALAPAILKNELFPKWYFLQFSKELNLVACAAEKGNQEDPEVIL